MKALDKGNNLRNLTLNLKRKFPDLPNNAKICSTCRQKSTKVTIRTTDSDSPDNPLPAAPTDVDEDQILSYQSDETSALNSADNHSKREIELEDMFSDLKEKFVTLEKNDPLRLTILTITPKSWSVKRICKEFNCSWKFAKKAKDLTETRGILAETTARSGKLLPTSTVEKIVDFYESDTNSRLMPGMKDVVSVKSEDGRCLMQSSSFRLKRSFSCI